jgi:membrane protease YdiL (CAAX protease family)
MATPAWGVFAAAVAVVTVVVVGLSARSADALEEAAPPARLLLWNVALTQGLFGAALALALWYARVPLPTLGLGDGALSAGALAAGAGAGVAAAATAEAAAVAARRAGVPVPTLLRESLAPETPAEWALLLGVVLPVVAGFEELLFRGALVGGLAAAAGVSPWLLVPASSLLFGLAHGAQGLVGMAVAGLLGAALAALFLLTGSLPAAILAHYVVNAVEFAVHEGVG